MRMLGYKFAILSAVFCCAAMLVCQAAAQVAGGAQAPHKRVIQPYTAEFKTTREQTLANGTTIRRETVRMEARDSLGRTMTAEQVWLDNGDGFTSYWVHDPVARTSISWNSNGKVVNVHNFAAAPESGHTGSSCAGAPESSREHAESTPRSNEVKVTHEDLGTQVFEGLEAKGSRTTHTTPIGLIGNDAPLVRVFESWIATSFPLTVHSVLDDPQSGKQTTDLTHFTPGEPDPAVFQPPAGYEIVVQESHKAGCEP